MGGGCQSCCIIEPNSLLQVVVEVHGMSFATNSTRAGGTGVGLIAACGTWERKRLLLFCEIASASVLSTPGMCVAENQKPWYEAKK